MSERRPITKRNKGGGDEPFGNRPGHYLPDGKGGKRKLIPYLKYRTRKFQTGKPKVLRIENK